MTTTTLTKTPRTLIAAATSNAASATTEGTPVDLRTKQGGILTAKITNGATGPAIQATIQVLIAHNSGATPTGAAEGADWKLIYEIGGGTTANGITRIRGLPIAKDVMHLHVRVTGNTGQAVTCEAFLSETTDAQSVA
jgi:hypothetical protein